MISTTLTALVLTAGLSANTIPSLQTDYPQALSVASTGNKPMAVFIGQGSGKLQQMFADGRITSEAARVLRESYVCVYLDTDAGAGKELAEKFSMPEGLVINTPSGSVQALRHAGAVAGADLTRELNQFSTNAQPTTTTVATAAPVVVSNTISTSPVYAGTSPLIVSGNCPGGNCRTVAAPTYTLTPTASFPFPTSSCPNGRCPNQR